MVVDGGRWPRPNRSVATLHEAWVDRRPLVVELAVDPEELRTPERYTGPVHALGPGFTFWRERLHFLVWANAYDARSGPPVWWHGRKAARRLADHGVTVGGPADLTTSDGTPWWVDGGPPDPPDPGDGTPVVHRWTAEAGRLVASTGRPPGADLAPDQLAAVDLAAGPARVIAPAGSGKTRVLTERLRLIVQRGPTPARSPRWPTTPGRPASSGRGRRRARSRRSPRPHAQQPGPVDVHGVRAGRPSAGARRVRRA